ncbi:hypothetical protein F0U61_12495 [Archangium violaceum]|uniref:hypothetical protein n=1 Tax=Archangium violaceum TaxID=83451 RepID=UPI002B30622E|nr:hypothetical protein F0U61_12495 [Archangium violaceum]
MEPRPRSGVSALGNDRRSTVEGFILQLRDNGYTANQIIGVANEILDFVIKDLKQRVPSTTAPADNGTHQGQ